MKSLFRSFNHSEHHLKGSINPEEPKPKNLQLLQPLRYEVDPLEQMPPDLLIADQSVEATGGPSSVQEALWIHGKQDGQDQFVREAEKPKQVAICEAATGQ